MLSMNEADYANGNGNGPEFALVGLALSRCMFEQREIEREYECVGVGFIGFATSSARSGVIIAEEGELKR